MILAGICGGSCSGKSTIVEGLKSSLSDLTIIHFDDFFIGKEKLEGQNITNWEDPKLYRLDDFEKTISSIKQGMSVEIEANSRESRHEGLKTRVLKPSKCIVVEGFLVFYTENVRQCFDKKIYLDITEAEIIRRRYDRMDKGGGKYSDEYINMTLIEEHRKNVVPQRQYADLIIDATGPINENIDKVAAFIKSDPN